MNINNINPYQGMQNAFHSEGGNSSSAGNKDVSAGIQGLSNPTVLIDPPLFPIAKYQNPNLMQKNTPTEAEVNDQKKVSAAPDAGTAKSEKIQPGSVLSIKA
jgi:hypothetical protein